MNACVVLLVPNAPASLPQSVTTDRSPTPAKEGALAAPRFPDIASVRRHCLALVRQFPAVSRVVAVYLDPPASFNPAQGIPGLEGVDELIVPEAGQGWKRSSLLSRLCEVLPPAPPPAAEEGDAPEQKTAGSSGTGSTVDFVWWAWADAPLLDADLAGRMFERHSHWYAEYTNADGWPAGFAPELVNRASLDALAWIAREDGEEVDRDLLFQVLQKDINAFEIETELSTVDLRPRRLSFFADSRRNWLLIERFLSHGYTRVEDTISFVDDHPQDLRTLPAYVSIQTNGRCSQNCTLCPWPKWSREQGGLLPTERSDSMALEDFKLILDKVVSFAGDAVIDLSLWGEAAHHPDIVGIVQAVLDRPSLSLLIETSGIGWQDGCIEAILEAAKAAPPRSGFPGSSRPGPLSWIVSMDAKDPARYRALRGDGQVEAVACAEKLLTLAPKSLWVQALRLDDGEEDLEAFWRHWKDRGAQVIIQKYDFFAGWLPQRRAADLSPLKRQPCWHLMRDVSVLVDGTVPLCREDLGRRSPAGNILKEAMENIWKGSGQLWESHASGIWPAHCTECDEYYTWNY